MGIDTSLWTLYPVHGHCTESRPEAVKGGSRYVLLGAFLKRGDSDPQAQSRIQSGEGPRKG